MAIPTIDSNILSIEEGNTRTLSLNNINASAAGVSNADILITIVPDPEASLAGDFLLDGGIVTAFTVADVENRRVEFAHDGSNNAPSYSIIASNGDDQSAPAPAQIFFDAVNDAPVVEANTLTIGEGETVTLNLDSVNLLTTDEVGESTAEELSYDIQSVTNGFFQRVEGEVVTKLGVSDDAFTQADVDNGLIQFVHDGSETAPTYQLRVVDSGLPGDGFDALPIGQSTSADITFLADNDTPIITKNEISLTEGATFTVTAANLAATDVEEDNATLSFTITSISGGRFELLDAPNGTVVTVLAAPDQASQSFTQAQITDGLIQFVNDPATDTPPAYTVEVSDAGRLTAASDPDADLIETASDMAAVDFTAVNDVPEIVAPDDENPVLLDLTEGTQVTLTSATLSVTDEESSAADLTYTVTD
ncbi:MAG: cadherin-like domain-containing protein, partial [Leptolyngbyaceae cyanobacterium]